MILAMPHAPRTLSLLLFACLLACPVLASAQDAIDELIEQASLRAGPTAMRDAENWSPGRAILLRDLGFEAAQLEAAFPDADVVLVSSYTDALAHAASAGAIIGYCDEELLSAAPHASWIQIYSAGAEYCLSVPRVSDGNVVLTNMQKMSSPVIAEHAIALLLSLTRRLPAFADAMENGDWERGPGDTAGMTTVYGKTMLVLGLGGIGTEIARRGAALGMRVVATRNSSRSGPAFVDYVGLSHEMGTLAAEADVIVNALPLTDDTRGMLDAAFFSEALVRKPYFINVGRGATVDTEALLNALRDGHVAGAGLDVTDPEPLPSDHALWRMPNVIITPHVSSRGDERHRHRLLVLENIRRYLAGDKLLNEVRPERGY
jgi:phosphoglycerate dehydrogenase-like enzyme